MWRPRVLSTYRQCIRTARRCPTAQGRIDMEIWARESFRNNMSSEERTATRQLGEAVEHIRSMREMLDATAPAVERRAAASSWGAAAEEPAPAGSSSSSYGGSSVPASAGDVSADQRLAPPPDTASSSSPPSTPAPSLVAGASSASASSTSLHAWLDSIALDASHYADLLKENGFDDVETVALASQANLESIGVKMGHALKMVKFAPSAS